MRPTADYAAGHLKGSLAIPLRGVFATWLGWLLPDPDAPIVIVRNPDQDPEEIIWQARKVGYSRIVGELAGGVAAWATAGEALQATPLADPARVDPATVVDVRQRRLQQVILSDSRWPIRACNGSRLRRCRRPITRS